VSFNFLKKNATTRSYPTDILIGELFVKAGVISQKQLDDTVRAAGSKHLHIGQMLTMSGMIQHRDLQAAVDAQSMLRDKVIDMAMASRCLKVAVKTGASFGDLVREELAIEQQASTQTNRLGEILMDAKLINRAVLDAAMQRSLATGLPLGRILVLNGSLSDSLLRTALEIQVRVRDGMMDRDEALQALKAEASGGKDRLPDLQRITGDHNSLKPVPQKKVRLGELLVLAGFLNETDVMSCLELGLLSDRQIGEVMVEQGYVSGQMLQVALTVQQMIEEDRFDREQAGAALRQMHETGRILPDVQDRIDGLYNAAQHQDPFQGVGGGNDHFSMQGESEAPQQNYDDAPSLESLMAAVGARDDADSDDSHSAGSNGTSNGSGHAEDGVSHNSHAGAAAQAVETFEKDSRHDTADIQSGSAVKSSASDNNSQHASSGNGQGVAQAAQVNAFESLLVAAKVLTSHDIDRALEMARQNPLALADVLRITGYLTEVGRQAVLDCNHMVEEGAFLLDQAAEVLDHCINQGRLRDLTLEQAMFELGWTREEGAEPAAAASDLYHDKAPDLESLMAAVEAGAAVESVNAEASAAPEPKAASVEADLLSVFGLDESVSDNSSRAVAQSAEIASQAEALLASLHVPAEEVTRAEESARQEIPSAFDTTAVLKSFEKSAEPEFNVATPSNGAKADDGNSLDSLLSRLGETVKEGADVSESVPGLDSLLKSSDFTNSQPCLNRLHSLEKPCWHRKKSNRQISFWPS
jgi:hypothetical protein